MSAPDAPDGFGNAATPTLTELYTAVARQAGAGAMAWLAAAVAEVTDTPSALPRRFAEAGRHCGRAVLLRNAAPPPDPPAGPVPFPDRPAGATPLRAQPPRAVPDVCLFWTVDDAVRALLLAALSVPAVVPTERVAELYHRGDAAERRGVLRSLSVIDTAHHALPLTADALRTNDPRLIAAALGPYGARWLDGAAWRQAVMKCLHCAIPLRAVAGLSARYDAELARMARYHARELASAGRPLPADLPLLLALPSPPTGTPCASSTPTSI
ncbi:EboA domain-containing protein [Streptomyces sp. NPDC046727]|uniref:EboA domain-containing protein n=1 Tax=Streptomyces sp. NPDC046727 TaxID=3155373 RepID=UPI0033CF2E00